MRVSKALLCVVVLTAALATAADTAITPVSFGYRIWGGEGRTISTYSRGNRFDVSLPKKLVGPPWKEGESNPPLGVADAIKRATETAKQLIEDDEDFAWGLEGATLKPWNAENGYWHWTVTFEQRVKRGGSSGRPARLTLMVLMDGSVVEPKQSAYPSK